MGNRVQIQSVETDIQDRNFSLLAVRTCIQLIVVQPVHIRANWLSQNLYAADLQVVRFVTNRKVVIALETLQ